MRKPLLAVLTASMLGTLSCGVFAPPSATLPSVDAGPPALDAGAPADARTQAVRDVLATRRTGLTDAELDALARTIVEESDLRGIETRLVMAVMHVESRFNAFAVSPVGAVGLMQILPSTGAELAGRYDVEWRGARTLFDPVSNVRLGVAYLRELTDYYDGEIETALAAYNWGPGHIDRRLETGIALPTHYPQLVLDAHRTQGERRS